MLPPRLSQLSLPILFALLEQNKIDPIKNDLIIDEIDRRLINYSLYQLDYMLKHFPSSSLKSLFIKNICKKLIEPEDFIELKSLNETLKYLSLEQLCVLLKNSHNEAVEYCVKKELETRIEPLQVITEDDKCLQKKKGRKKNAEYKRK